MNPIWKVLEIDPTDDIKIIKRAYAKKLKTLNLQMQPREFQELRHAYDQAKESIDSSSESDFSLFSGHLFSPFSSQKTTSDNTSSSSGSKIEWNGRNERDLISHTSSPEPQTKESGPPSPTSIGVDSAYLHAMTEFIQSLSNLMQENKQEEALKLYFNFIQSETLLNLLHRQTFELEFLYRLADWRERHFPILVAQDFLSHIESPDIQDTLFLSLSSEVERRIEIQSNYDTFTNENRKDKAFQILLDDFETKKFKKLQRKGSFLWEVRDILTEVEDKYPEFFDYNLNTETVEWWHQAIRQTPFTTRYLKAAFWGLIFMVPILKYFFKVDVKSLVGYSSGTTLLIGASGGFLFRYCVDRLKNYFRYQNIPFFKVNIQKLLNKALSRAILFCSALGLALSIQYIPQPYVFPIPLLALFLLWLSAGPGFYVVFLFYGATVYFFSIKSLEILFPDDSVLFSHYLPATTIGVTIGFVTILVFGLLSRWLLWMGNILYAILLLIVSTWATHKFLAFLAS